MCCACHISAACETEFMSWQVRLHYVGKLSPEQELIGTSLRLWNEWTQRLISSTTDYPYYRTVFERRCWLDHDCISHFLPGATSSTVSTVRRPYIRVPFFVEILYSTRHIVDKIMYFSLNTGAITLWVHYLTSQTDKNQDQLIPKWPQVLFDGDPHYCESPPGMLVHTTISFLQTVLCRQ